MLREDDMATVGDDGKIRGGKVQYHAERALEAIGWGPVFGKEGLSEDLGRMLDTLAYDHARGAARAALNRTRKEKR